MNINKHFLLNLFRIIPCLVIGLLSTVNLKAQCPTADIELNTQHEVDNFIIEYPNCKEFPYNLKVRHGSDVTNLDGLQNLEKVIGDLYIEWNPVLIDISGLNNLQSVGGTLWIYNNSSLASISDLTSLESTNWFLVWYNIALQNISGLEKLTKTGNFTINDNPLLTVVDGTSNLVTMQGSLHIKNNPLLAQLPNFNKIEIITQAFTIEDSPLFSDFNTFTNLNYIGGGVFISNNSALQNLDGLSKVTRVNGDLLIQNNPQLSNISGLSNISQGTISGSGLTIRDNPLVSVCNLPNICEYLATSKPRDISGNAGDCITEQAVIDACSQPNCPDGDLYFYSQDDLNQFAVDYPWCKHIEGSLSIWSVNISDLSPLSNIITIAGDLSISTTSLTSLNGLHNLTTVASIEISENELLVNIAALENIDPVTIQGLTITRNRDLSVCDLPNFCTYLSDISNPRSVYDNAGNCYSMLTLATACNIQAPECPTGGVFFSRQSEIDWFGINYPNCTHISGDLLFYDYSDEGNAFWDLTPLSNIQSIAGDLHVKYTSGLGSLDGLHNLTSIGGVIEIQGIRWLSDISALQHIDPTTIIGLLIEDNGELEICNLPNFCTYLTNDAATHPRSISGNAGDCISEQAVIEACSTPEEGCLNITSSFPQWPQNTFVPQCTGSQETINLQCETGEYSKVEVTAGTVYTFSSSIATDYITISDENGEVVYTHGTSSVTWTATANEVVRFYLHLDEDCNSSTAQRSRIVQCGQLICPPGDVNLTTQAEVNQFAIDYPNCTEIAGSLLIGALSGNPPSNITDLSGLGNIIRVNGWVSVQNNGALQNLEGLNNLRSIGGSLNIQDNAALINVNGLSSLTNAVDFLQIWNNVSLTNISGLQNMDLATISSGQGLFIAFNTALSLCNLPNICIYLQGAGARTIANNAGDCVSDQAVIDACNNQPQEGDLCTNAVSIQSLFGHPQDEPQTSGTYSSEGMTSDGDPDFGDFCLRDDLVSMWFTFTGDGERYYIRSRYCGAFFYTDPNGSLYSGSCDDISPIRCHYDIDGSDENADANFHFYLNTEVGKTYYILVQAASTDDFITYNEFGSFCLEVTKLGEECIVHIPDPAFKAYLLENWEINTYDDDVIWCEEAERFFGTMDCSALDISDLTGVEAFTNLSSLNVSDNNLTTLDLSENIYLSQLNCSDNNLNRLDLPNNEDMWYINCSNNRLGVLDVSKIKWLEVLDCSDNNLIKLDISDNWKVSELLCSNNFLNELNLANTNNGFLSTIHAHDNPNLTCIQVDDVEFSNTNWTGGLFLFDPQHEFNEMCINCIHVDPSFTANFLLANAACGGDHIRMIDYTFLDVEMDQNAQFFWDFGDGTTSDERDPIHIYSLPGQYKVTLEVLVEECENPFMISKYIDIASCHRSESDNIQYANVFPNPSSGLFMLKANLPIKGDVFVRIMDMNGRELHTNKYTEMKNIYDDYLLREKGVFIVEIRHLLGVEYHQLIVVD